MDYGGVTNSTFERELRSVVPLCNFRIPEDTLQLAEDLEVRILDAVEAEVVRERTNPFVASQCKYCISTKWIERFRSMNELMINLEKAYLSTDVVTALRLFDNGNVTFPKILFRLEKDEPSPLGFHGWAETGGEIAVPIGDKYSLTASNLREFQDFFKEINPVLSTSSIDEHETGLLLALRRFNYSYWRKSLEDKIVDVWIGFESLVGDQSENDTSLMIRRLTTLLDLGEVKRNDLRWFLRKSYDVRCDVVHGRTVHAAKVLKETKMTLGTLVSLSQRLLARGAKLRLCVPMDYWRDRRGFLKFTDENTGPSGNASELRAMLENISSKVLTESTPLSIRRKKDLARRS